jgi:Zn finger protein HypA/HybF involved in hydrogenase expression
MKILDMFDVSDIQSKLDESKSFREFLLKIGSSCNGSASYKSIKNQLINLGIKIPEFNYVSEIKININKRIDDNDVFVKDSSYSRCHLKERIIKNKLIDYRCNECGNVGYWNGKILSLHLEHKNGVNNDNRLGNLTFLCPNCHSQTETYGGKNVKKREKRKCKCGNNKWKTSKSCVDCSKKLQRKVERPTLEQLKIDVEELGYVGSGKKYGVSDNSIRKWIRLYEKTNL